MHNAQTQYNHSMMALMQSRANLLRITWLGTWRMSAIAGAVSLGYWLGMVHQYGWWICVALCEGFVLYTWISSWSYIRRTPWWMIARSYHVAVPDECDWEAAQGMAKQMKGKCLAYEPFGVAFSHKQSAMAFKLIHGGQ